MALNKQTIALSFSKGVDTKTDSKQLAAGKLLNLENVVLKKVGKFQKRYGYGVIALNNGVANGNALATYKNELVAYDGQRIYSYSTNDDSLYDKGIKIAADIATQPVIRNSYEQQNPDSAYHPNGFSVYAWEDSSGGVRYSVFDVTTNQTIVTSREISPTGSKPKVIKIGNYVIILYLDNGNELYCQEINASTPSSAIIPYSLATLIGKTISYFDAKYFNSSVYVAYSDGTSTYIFTLNSALVQSATLTVSAASSCLGIFNDASNNVWVVYNSTNTLKYFIYNSALTVQVLAPTTIEVGTAPFVNCTGIYNGFTVKVYYELSGDIPENNYIKSANLTSGGVVSGISVLLRSVGLYSKVFVSSTSDYYMVVTHQSDLQPTYFIYNLTKSKFVGKLAPSLGGGLATTGMLAEVSSVSTDNFLMAYEYKDFVQSVGGDVTTQTGINSVNIKFNQPIYNAEVGNQLHSSGAMISSYDSQNINELGFNLYPETISSNMVINGGGLKQGSYQYSAVYEWMDAQGQLHRSAPSVAYTLDTTLNTKYYSGTLTGQSMSDPVGGPYFVYDLTNIGTKITGPGITGTAYFTDQQNIIGATAYVNSSGTYKIEPGTGFLGSSTLGQATIQLKKDQYPKLAADVTASSSTFTLREDYQIPIGSVVEITYDPVTGATTTCGVLAQDGRTVTIGTGSIPFTTSNFTSSYEGIFLVCYKLIYYQNGSYITSGSPILHNVDTTYVNVGEEYTIPYPGRTATVVSKTSNTVTFSSNFTSNVNYATTGGFGNMNMPYRNISIGTIFTEYNNSGSNAFNTITVKEVNYTTGVVTVDKIAAASKTNSTFVSASAVSSKLTLPTLRITNKNNTQIGLYRTVVNGTVFYRVNTLTDPIINDTTVDSVQYSDVVTDEILIGNEQLYTTGGEVENIAPPASNVIGTYKNRLLVVPNEDPISFWYSKQVRTNTPIEFNDSFIQRVPERGGSLTAVHQMDDKLLIFKQDTIYVMVGDGPSVSGVNNDFTDPQLITADCGCSDQKSVVTLPTGVIYKSQKGFYLLDRALNVKYIGSDVEAFNSYTVTSAKMIETENQVRFTLSSGDTIVYDYYVEQWAIFKGVNAADAVNFQDKYTYIVPSGQIRKENTSYLDNTSLIPMVIETGWLNLAGILNYQRIYHIMLVGTYKSPHTLQIQLYRDFIDTPYETVTIPVTTAPTKYQYRIFPSIQKCESIKIKITELQTSPYGEGFDISAINIEVGVKRGQNKLSPDESYG